MREALKLALVYLKDNQHIVADHERHAYVMEYNDAIERIEAALAAPVQEPVGEVVNHVGDVDYISYVPLPGTLLYTTPPAAPVQEPVYSIEKLDAAYELGFAEGRKTTPPAAQRQWVGLTDEEGRSVCRVGPVYAPDGVVTRNPLEYRKELEGVALMAVRQAEAKLKEKNHG